MFVIFQLLSYISLYSLWYAVMNCWVESAKSFLAFFFSLISISQWFFHCQKPGPWTRRATELGRKSSPAGSNATAKGRQGHLENQAVLGGPARAWDGKGQAWGPRWPLEFQVANQRWLPWLLDGSQGQTWVWEEDWWDTRRIQSWASDQNRHSRTQQAQKQFHKCLL